MIKRDVLDYLGNKTGEIEFPDGTSEDTVSKRLAEYAAPPVAPSIPDVTPRQIRQALVMSGIAIADVEAAINSLPEPYKSLIMIEWDYSTAFQRNRPSVIQLGQMLGKTSEELDNLWKLAASL